jgi:MFS family permease
VGTILGSLLAGKLAELLGRKRTLTMLGIAYFVSSLGCGFAWNWASLLIFRFLGGIAIGVASVVSPMYIAEIAPPESRGRLVAVSQFNTVLGILVAYLRIHHRPGLCESRCRWLNGGVAMDVRNLGCTFSGVLLSGSANPRATLAGEAAPVT